MKIEALLDTNVIVATLAEDHQHHGESIGLLLGRNAARFAVTAHAFAEAFNTLSRRSTAAPHQWAPDRVVSALDTVRAKTVLIGLTPVQTYDAMRDYAADGGIGARVYDKLIGQAAVLRGIPAIVTWNARHMRSLFPELDVRTPADWSDRPR